MTADTGQPGKPGFFAYTRRCSDCKMSWPHEDRFMICPFCKRSTWLGSRKKKEVLTSHQANEILFELHMAEKTVPADELEAIPVLEEGFQPVHATPQQDSFD